MQTIEFQMTDAKNEAGELAKYISALIDNDIAFTVKRDEVCVAVTITGKKNWTK